MKEFVHKLISKTPLLGWPLHKFGAHQEEMERLRWKIESLSAEVAFAREGDRLRSLLKLLHPLKVTGFDKVRIGARHDGGYVMLNDFAEVSRAYSLGIADEVSWDLEMAAKGIRVDQFDYSIRKTPVAHPLFHFSQKKVTCMEDIRGTREQKPLLKIDIEGSEWDFFANASEGSLSTFSQIVGEFHGFSRYHEPEWQSVALRALQKLHSTHQLVHLHGNNGGNTFWANGVLVPDLLELTYVLRTDYRFEDTAETFPGTLDSANEVGPDVPLDALLKSFSA